MAQGGRLALSHPPEIRRHQGAHHRWSRCPELGGGGQPAERSGKGDAVHSPLRRQRQRAGAAQPQGPVIPRLGAGREGESAFGPRRRQVPLAARHPGEKGKGGRHHCQRPYRGDGLAPAEAVTGQVDFYRSGADRHQEDQGSTGRGEEKL